MRSEFKQAVICQLWKTCCTFAECYRRADLYLLCGLSSMIYLQLPLDFLEGSYFNWILDRPHKTSLGSRRLTCYFQPIWMGHYLIESKPCKKRRSSFPLWRCSKYFIRWTRISMYCTRASFHFLRGKKEGSSAPEIVKPKNDVLKNVLYAALCWSQAYA